MENYIFETGILLFLIIYYLFKYIRSRKLRNIYENTTAEERENLDKYLEKDKNLKAYMKPLPRWITVPVAFILVILAIYMLLVLVLILWMFLKS